ncbi:MAG: sulfite exporter TauE/SafE family protein [Bdellovibrio sp.]|nr:MAG: sulfite exporter TauE/SafE family protein [Bdellovibrio sp.]
MEILGYGLASFMGLVLGFLGGGGSILTIPILVYIFGVSATYATAYSLFIVGSSSLIGSFNYFKRGLIDVKTGLLFAIPAFTSVYSVRKFLMPSLPEQIMSLDSFIITKDLLILVVFAVVMLLASYSMIKGRKNLTEISGQTRSPVRVAIYGLLIGALTGFVGAGGGFIIIPALVLFAGLDMKVAVGTSLFIITINSLIGFIGDIEVLPNINWKFLLNFLFFSILGILGGTLLSKKVSSHTLKPLFGWFVLVMGTAILLKELFFHHAI